MNNYSSTTFLRYTSGDSGGPLIYRDNNTDYHMGTVSWGLPVCEFQGIRPVSGEIHARCVCVCVCLFVFKVNRTVLYSHFSHFYQLNCSTYIIHKNKKTKLLFQFF